METNRNSNNLSLTTATSIIDQLLPQDGQSGSLWSDACSVAPIYSTSFGNGGPNYLHDEQTRSLFGATTTRSDQVQGFTSPFYNSLSFTSDSSSSRVFNINGNNLIDNLNNQLSSTRDNGSNIFSGNSSFSSAQASETRNRQPRPSQPDELSAGGSSRTYSSVLHSTGQIEFPAFQRQNEQQPQQEARLPPSAGQKQFNSQHLTNQSRFIGEFLSDQYPVPYQRAPRQQHPNSNSGTSNQFPCTSGVVPIGRTVAAPGASLRGDKMFTANPFGGAAKRRSKPPFFAATTGHQDESRLGFKLDALGANVSSSDESERFSRKVFVGGLPPDIDEEEIKASFRRFGPLVVDWPHKAESKSYFPPKGYAFLLFQDEASVQSLIESCFQEEDKLYLCVSSPTIKDKPVQIRPWRLNDSDFVLDSTLALDPRKTVFVGGVPRPLKACELATIMNNLYGGVSYAGIDTDPELKYPKGAGRVAFSNHQSYIAAISARFVHIHHGEVEKRVEVKPYVLDDQFCDECHGSRCNNKFAPFFCANITCLRYYCDNCWSTVHSQPGKEFHKPLVKEGGDRPRGSYHPSRW